MLLMALNIDESESGSDRSDSLFVCVFQGPDLEIWKLKAEVQWSQPEGRKYPGS